MTLILLLALGFVTSFLAGMLIGFFHRKKPTIEAAQTNYKLWDEYTGRQYYTIDFIEITIDKFIGHDGYGWYWWENDCQDEGCVGAFPTESAAHAHAKASLAESDKETTKQ